MLAHHETESRKGTHRSNKKTNKESVISHVTFGPITDPDLLINPGRMKAGPTKKQTNKESVISHVTFGPITDPDLLIKPGRMKAGPTKKTNKQRICNISCDFWTYNRP